MLKISALVQRPGIHDNSKINRDSLQYKTSDFMEKFCFVIYEQQSAKKPCLSIIPILYNTENGTNSDCGWFGMSTVLKQLEWICLRENFSFILSTA